MKKKERRIRDLLEQSLEAEKKQALKELQEWIDGLPDEMIGKPRLTIGEITLAPRQMMHEVETLSESGRYIINSLTEARMALSAKEELVDLFPKKMLLVRTLMDNDHYTRFTYQAAGEFKKEAKKKNWIVIDLKKGDVIKKNFNKILKDENPSFVAFYGHGLADRLRGQYYDENKKTYYEYPVVDIFNVHLLSGRIISVVGCKSASILGVQAIQKGTKAYIGYKYIHVIAGPFLSQFIKTSNSVNYHLLEGKTIQEAVELAKDEHFEEAKNIKDKNIGNNPTDAASMLGNGLGLRCLGDEKARI